MWTSLFNMGPAGTELPATSCSFRAFPVPHSGAPPGEFLARSLPAAPQGQAFLKSSRRGSPFGFIAGTTWSRHTMGRGGWVIHR